MQGTTRDYSYLGVGKIYMRDINGSGGLVPIGNVSALNFAVQEEQKELMDFTAAGGGARNEVRRVKGVEAKITLHDLSPDNLALALYGESDAVAAGSVSGEVIGVVKGALIPLANVGASNVALTHGLDAWEAETAYALDALVHAGTHVYKCTTAGTSGASAPTWKTDGTDTTDGTVTWADLGAFTPVAGTDYEVRPAGLWIPADSNIQTPTVTVAYQHPGQDVVEALTQAAGEYELMFDGVNEARSGKAAVVRVHRIRFGAAANLDLIGDDYAGLELTGKLLSDDTQGAGLSRFFRATVVQ
jgi:hypothetical protein